MSTRGFESREASDERGGDGGHRPRRQSAAHRVEHEERGRHGQLRSLERAVQPKQEGRLADQVDRELAVRAEAGEDFRDVAFAERRRRLEALLRDARPPLMVTPVTDDPATAAGWLDRFTGNGVDGVVAKHRGLRYESGRRAMVKVKREATADCVVAGLRVSGDEVTSLVLGLYARDGALRHVGVASAFGRELRRELFGRLWALAVPLEGHPWELGFGIERRPAGRLPGGAGVWMPGMSLDWVPVRPVLVCEVAYTQLDGDRFRHPARLRRWRPDRTPESCTFEQLENARPAA